MSKSSDLMAKRRSYYSFRDNSSALASKLKSIVDEIDKQLGKVSEGYNIDDESGDGYALRDIKTSLSDKYLLLVNQTIPAIDSKISSLSRQIDLAVQAEEEALLDSLDEKNSLW